MVTLISVVTLMYTDTMGKGDKARGNDRSPQGMIQVTAPSQSLLSWDLIRGETSRFLFDRPSVKRRTPDVTREIDLRSPYNYFHINDN